MPKTRRFFVLCSGSLLGLAALLLAPEEARAEEGYHAFTLGMSLSYSLGARPSFGFGGELRYTYYVDHLPLGYHAFGTFALRVARRL